jgi:predicted DNA-binding WGR domain protein
MLNMVQSKHTLICPCGSRLLEGFHLSPTITSRYVNPETKEFWNAEINGKFVTIQFGVVGATRHTASREFMSHSEALHFVEDRIAIKLKNGYKKVD